MPRIDDLEAGHRSSAPIARASAHLRGVQALEALATAPRTAAEVARELGVNRSTGLRILTDLEAERYVTRDPITKRYKTVASRLWALLADHHDQTDWRVLVEPSLSLIRDEFGEAVCLAIPANGDMVYLAFFPSLHPITLRESLGLVRPMHCSAIGKAYLSALASEALDVQLGRIDYSEGSAAAARGPIDLRIRLEEARTAGFAIDREETHEGGVCVAVPLWIAGALVGSVGVQAPAMRFPEARQLEIGARLRDEFQRFGRPG